MIGRAAEAVQRLDSMFHAVAPGVDAAPWTPGRTDNPEPVESGYLRRGPSGAGH